MRRDPSAGLLAIGGKVSEEVLERENGEGGEEGIERKEGWQIENEKQSFVVQTKKEEESIVGMEESGID